MQIYSASVMGVCFGVERSLFIAEDTYARYGKAFSLGPLIHNPQETDRLRSMITPVESLEEAVSETEKPVIIVRSHGAVKEFFDKAIDSSFVVIDATCPLVKKNQELLAALGNEGYATVIVGDKEHPEVTALVTWANGSVSVINTPQEAFGLPYAPRVAVMAQTTQDEDLFSEITEVLRGRFPDLAVHNTICAATKERQRAVFELSQKVDAMVVIGGKNSSNTGRLAEISAKNNIPALRIETAGDLDINILKNFNRIGITAGASTPNWIIKEVVVKMSDVEKIVNEEVLAEEVQEQLLVAESVADESTAAEEVKEEIKAETPKTDAESFAEEYNRGIDAVKTGARVKGIIVRVRPDELLVDIGGKSEGILPSSELMREEAANIPANFKIGNEIEVLITRRENKEGYPMLSKKRIDQELAWDKLIQAQADGQPVTGKIIEVVRGGLLADVGIRGFIPASMVSTSYVEDLHAFVGKELPMKVEECDIRNRKLVLSPKAVMLAAAQKKKTETMATIEVGQTVRGTVSRLAPFGAFIDLGGVDGLLHISEMAWYRVNSPSDIMKEGDEMDVYVLSVDCEKEKVSLGLKQLSKDPWSLVAEKYQVGSVHEVKVVRVAAFGAFAELETGVEGLIHISQISHQRLVKTEDGVKPGETVSVKVLNVDVDAHRISLSIKETIPAPEGVLADTLAPAVEEAAAEIIEIKEEAAVAEETVAEAQPAVEEQETQEEVAPAVEDGTEEANTEE